MKDAVAADLKRLRSHAFDRAAWAEDVLRCYHGALPKLNNAAAQQIRPLYEWLFVPVTLWPFNVQNVLEEVLDILKRGKRLMPTGMPA